MRPVSIAGGGSVGAGWSGGVGPVGVGLGPGPLGPLGPFGSLGSPVDVVPRLPDPPEPHPTESAARAPAADFKKFLRVVATGRFSSLRAAPTSMTTAA